MVRDAEKLKKKCASVKILFIRFHQGAPAPEIYERAISNYDLVLHIIESPDRARTVSETSRIPIEYLIDSAEQVVKFLLFNKEKNPFLSLGLNALVSQEEMTSRWKRLIRLYHPDRAPGLNDEMAKAINEAFKIASGACSRSAHQFASSLPKAGNKNNSNWKNLHARFAKYAPLSMILFSISALSLGISLLVISELNRRESRGEQAISTTPPKKITAPHLEPLFGEQPMEIQALQNASVSDQEGNRPGISEGQASREAERKEVPESRPVHSKTENPEKDAKKVENDEQLPNAPLPAISDTEDIHGPGLNEPEESLIQNKPEPVSMPAIQERIESGINKSLVDEINALLNSFISSSAKGKVEEYMSLFDTEATENGRDLSSLLDEYRARFEKDEHRYELRRVRIRIKNAKNAEISADYILQKLSKNENATSVHSGQMKMLIHKKQNEFRIFRYEYD